MEIAGFIIGLASLLLAGLIYVIEKIERKRDDNRHQEQLREIRSQLDEARVQLAAAGVTNDPDRFVQARVHIENARTLLSGARDEAMVRHQAIDEIRRAETLIQSIFGLSTARVFNGEKGATASSADLE